MSPKLSLSHYCELIKIEDETEVLNSNIVIFIKINNIGGKEDGDTVCFSAR